MTEKTLHQIKNRFTGTILFEGKFFNLKLCVEAAVERNTDLYGADLHGADLRGAYLRGADLHGADLRGADLRGAYLRGVDLRGVGLRGAHLRGVDLRGVDLRGVDLSGVDLRGADLGENITAEIQPLQLLGLHWDIYIFDEHMAIGCETHLITDWNTYKDSRIKKMSHYALDFWLANRLAITTLANRHMAEAVKIKGENK